MTKPRKKTGKIRKIMEILVVSFQTPIVDEPNCWRRWDRFLIEFTEPSYDTVRLP